MSAPAFSFTAPVLDGESSTITLGGFQLTATIHDDPDAGTPWENSDGHGEVTGWERRDKRPGERILNSDRDGSKRFYDYAGAVARALAENWDTAPYGQGTPGERAARAADADFEYLRAWCNSEWRYVGVAVTVSKNGIQLTGQYDHALWGIEDTADAHLAETATDLAPQALEAAQQALEGLCAPVPA
jgi:hypothetical protein